VRDFCVATLDEAVALRRAGILGQLLILGYVHPTEFPTARRYHLTLTLVDAEYARAAADAPGVLHAHLKLDTGMHRLGIPWDDTDTLAELLSSRGLYIDGAFTHLCAADGRTEPERTYTELQLHRFEEAMTALERRGISRPETHVQSSYGLLNYPSVRCSLARPGIALYGVLSGVGDATDREPELCPALTLKARVAHVAPLQAGQPMGYGMAHVAERDQMAAVLSIGYADGLPRALSNGRGYVVLNGQRAPILGRVCMDQVTVDVTGIPGVHAGDEAVLIGPGVPAGQVAEQAGTISNELLSRLGSRLRRIYMP
jgi:serine/alanine racemase